MGFIEHEPTFKRKSIDWFGTRFFFEKKRGFSKETLEVTVYDYDLKTSYRYIHHSFRGIKCAIGFTTDIHDEFIPYWMRSIFLRFFK